MMAWILFAVAGSTITLVGFVGCFVPVLPGPAIAYAALWIPLLSGYPVSTTCLVAGAAVTALVMLVDYVLPAICAKKFKCSRWGVFGCFAGSLVGLFFLPYGIILGPFFGTVAGELIAGRKIAESLRGGAGALLGYVLCLGLKLAAVGLFAWWYFTSLPPFPE